MVRTSPFHGENMGSIPIRDVNIMFKTFKNNLKLSKEHLFYHNYINYTRIFLLKIGYILLGFIFSFLIFLYYVDIIFQKWFIPLEAFDFLQINIEKISDTYSWTIFAAFFCAIFAMLIPALIILGLNINSGLFYYEAKQFWLLLFLIGLNSLFSFLFTWNIGWPLGFNFYYYTITGMFELFPFTLKIAFNDYIKLFFSLFLNIFLIFQIPSLFYFLIYRKIIDYKFIISFRNIFYILLFSIFLLFFTILPLKFFYWKIFFSIIIWYELSLFMILCLSKLLFFDKYINIKENTLIQNKFYIKRDFFFKHKTFFIYLKKKNTFIL